MGDFLRKSPICSLPLNHAKRTTAPHIPFLATILRLRPHRPCSGDYFILLVYENVRMTPQHKRLACTPVA